MIASVRGNVLSAAGSTVVIDVAGVGYLVQVTSPHALSLRPGQEALLHTALIVRKDDMSLFGFATADELDMFDLLRGVTGVGPKSALGVLATLTPEQIATAVAAEDDGPFRQVSGIGSKTAKLIVVSLAGKILVPTVAVGHAKKGSTSTTQDVVTALVGLGWNERVAARAVDEVLATVAEGEQPETPALLRLALAHLGPNR